MQIKSNSSGSSAFQGCPEDHIKQQTLESQRACRGGHAGAKHAGIGHIGAGHVGTGHA